MYNLEDWYISKMNQTKTLGVLQHKMVETLGKHLIIEFFGCPPEKIDDQKFTEQVLVEAARAAKLTILEVFTHKFSPQGVTGVVMLSESHISIHTWPEKGYAALDVYTCGEGDPKRALDVLKKRLEPKMAKVSELRRGILE